MPEQVLSVFEAHPGCTEATPEGVSLQGVDTDLRRASGFSRAKPRLSGGEQQMLAIGRALMARSFRPGDIVLNTFSYQMVPAAHELDEALARIGCTVVPTGVGQTDQQVRIALAVGATGYVGTPSFLMTFIEKAAELGAGRLPFEVAQVGGEPFPESMRRVLEERYAIMARQGFGTADLGVIAYEGPTANGMHLAEDAVVQICDPASGEPLPVGALGEVVATVNKPTYPMIRFATGDLSVLTDEPSACGRTALRMLGWRGRADEVTKVRGLFIHPRQADEVAARVPGIARWQVVVGREGHQDTLAFRPIFDSLILKVSVVQ